MLVNYDGTDHQIANSSTLELKFTIVEQIS